MREATGKDHEQWFRILDRWGGTKHNHTEIARYVIDELGVDGWWGQSITVSYERARGMRAVGQMKDGWTINASKTINHPVDDLFDAIVEERIRKEWLPDADLTLRTATKPKSARYNWEDGSTRLNVSFESKGQSKATVFLSHERLPDADTAEAMKAYWRSSLVDLKAHLESRGER